MANLGYLSDLVNLKPTKCWEWRGCPFPPVSSRYGSHFPHLQVRNHREEPVENITSARSSRQQSNYLCHDNIWKYLFCTKGFSQVSHWSCLINFEFSLFCPLRHSSFHSRSLLAISIMIHNIWHLFLYNGIWNSKCYLSSITWLCKTHATPGHVRPREATCGYVQLRAAIFLFLEPVWLYGGISHIQNGKMYSTHSCDN